MFTFNLPTLPTLVGYLPDALQVPVLTGMLFVREIGHLALEKVGLVDAPGVDLVGKVEAPADAPLAVLPEDYVDPFAEPKADFAPVKAALLSGNIGSLSAKQKIALIAAFTMVMGPASVEAAGSEAVPLTLAHLSRIACSYEFIYGMLAVYAGAAGLYYAWTAGQGDIGKDFITAFKDHPVFMLLMFVPGVLDAVSSFVQQWFTAFGEAIEAIDGFSGVTGLKSTAFNIITALIATAFTFIAGALGEWWAIKDISFGNTTAIDQAIAASNSTMLLERLDDFNPHYPFFNWAVLLGITIPATVYYLLLNGTSIGGMFDTGSLTDLVKFHWQHESKQRVLTEMVVRQGGIAFLRGAGFAGLAHNALGIDAYTGMVFAVTVAVQYLFCATASLREAFGKWAYKSQEALEKFFDDPDNNREKYFIKPFEAGYFIAKKLESAAPGITQADYAEEQYRVTHPLRYALTHMSGNKKMEIALTTPFGSALGLWIANICGQLGGTAPFDASVNTWSKFFSVAGQPLPVILMIVGAIAAAALAFTSTEAEVARAAPGKTALRLQLGSDASRLFQQLSYGISMYNLSQTTPNSVLAALFKAASFGFTSAPAAIVFMALVFPYLWKPQHDKRTALNDGGLSALENANTLAIKAGETRNFWWEFIRPDDEKARAQQAAAGNADDEVRVRVEVVEGDGSVVVTPAAPATKGCLTAMFGKRKQGALLGDGAAAPTTYGSGKVVTNPLQAVGAVAVAPTDYATLSGGEREGKDTEDGQQVGVDGDTTREWKPRRPGKRGCSVM